MKLLTTFLKVALIKDFIFFKLSSLNSSAFPLNADRISMQPKDIQKISNESWRPCLSHEHMSVNSINLKKLGAKQFTHK